MDGCTVSWVLRPFRTVSKLTNQDFSLAHVVLHKRYGVQARTSALMRTLTATDGQPCTSGPIERVVALSALTKPQCSCVSASCIARRAERW
jgi:hypothetical protein